MTAEARRSASVGRLAEGYWVRSRQPLASLIFIAPWLAAYEAGVILLGPDAVRNGADAWLRGLLDLMGFGQYFLLPVLTVCLLLAWHHTTHQPWRFSRGLFWGMMGECILLALGLRLLLQVQGLLLQTAAGPVGLGIRQMVAVAVGFLGAGVYEELLFRLILLTLVIALLARLGVKPRARLIAAVLATSLLFALAHHVGPYGEPFRGFPFAFRAVAGGCFSVLFLYRGFGIAAGTHAGYDILIGLMAQ